MDNIDYIEEFRKIGIIINSRDFNKENIKTKCPECEKAGRAKEKDTSLSANIKNGTFNCHRETCRFSGKVGEGIRHGNHGFDFQLEKAEKKPKDYILPTPPKEYILSEEFLDWFEKRGISSKTLKACKIYSDSKCIAFPYFEGDKLINVKYRTIDKRFYFTTKSEIIPFNINAIKGEKNCIITEGEIDALSFIEAGIPYAVSVPNGAGTNLSCFERFYEGYFDDKEIIYLAIDNDEAGLKLTNNLKEIFLSYKLKIVHFSQKIKDANQELTTNGKESLIECLKQANPCGVLLKKPQKK